MKTTRQLLAMLLALALLTQLIPATVFATESEIAEGAIPSQEINTGDVIYETETAPAEIVYEVEDLRTANGKHFRMSDGSFIAVRYGTDVHYLAEDGSFENIDNSPTLVTRGGSGQYRTENNGELRVFSQDLSDGSLFYAQSGSVAVGLSLYTPDATEEVGTMSSSNEEITPLYNTTATATPEVQAVSNSTGYDDAFYPDTFRSSITYSNVYPGVDLQYEAYGYDVKESIIVNTLQSSYSYSFVLDLTGLTPELQEDGSILLMDISEAAVYCIPAPYMYDAEGRYSEDVTYTLTLQTNGTYQLTVDADEIWIESATLPVTIDPTLIKVSTATTASIRSTYIIKGNPTSRWYTADHLFVGYGAVENELGVLDGTYEAIIYAGDLPEIPEGSLITEALLQIYQTNFSTSYSSYMQLQAYQLTRDKNASETYNDYIARINWNVIYPSNDTTLPYADDMLDFANATAATVNSYLSLDITRAAKNWYETDNNNHCILLRSNAAYSNQVNATFRPYRTCISFLVSYRNDVGVESYYTYQTQSIGRAGVGYVADHTLRLTLANTIVSSASETLPYSLSLIYNSSQAGQYFTDNNVDIHSNQFDKMSTGAGWKLSAQATVSCVYLKDDDSNIQYYVYNDGDGTEHYFFEQADGTIRDEDGLGLTMIVEDGAEDISYFCYTITDEKGNEWYYKYGKLTHIKDSFGNYIYFAYNGKSYSGGPVGTPSDQLTSIWRLNKGAAAERLALLEYNADYTLKSITNEAGQVTTFNYTSATINNTTVNLLTSIVYPDENKATYTYVDGLLTKAYDDEAGCGVNYAYTNGRISKISECNEKGATGAVMTCTLANNRCTWTDWGSDRTKDSADDIITEVLFDG